MRFAWIRKNSTNLVPAKRRSIRRLIYIAYNVIYWIPIILPFTGVIDYRTGFIAFFIFIIIRAVANLYRNNILKPEKAELFPLRSI